MEIGDIIGIWVAAALTFVMFSFLYGDNPVFKAGEHLFLGVSLGYSWCLYYYSQIYPQAIAPLQVTPEHPKREWAVLLPILLGIFILLRLIPKLAWLSRYSFAVYIGGAAGISVPAEMSGRLLPQVASMMMPLWHSADVAWGQVITNWVILIGVVATVIFFFFSLEHRGVVGRISRIGVLFIMISMGASFGNTVMARVSLLIGRFQFLLDKWIHGAILPQ